MLAVNTTVVAVVAPPGQQPLKGVRAGNVRVTHPAPDLPDVERAREVWEQAHRAAALYLLHDADPLAGVASAWAAHFDGTGAAGELEVATADVLARWRARTVDLPDYYLVVDAERLPPTLQHWYLGVLAGRAPVRVVAVRPETSLADELPALRAGPWWPPLDRLLDGIDRVVPDRAGLFTQDATAAGPDQEGER